MEWNDLPEIDLYSDGGAEPNPGKGGFGVILSYKGKTKEFSQGYQLTTNNRMELMGVIHGLEKLKTKSIVNVFTDSQYVINGISKGWAEKWKSNNWYSSQKNKASNFDLWERLLYLISLQKDVNFNWVKGHAGHVENERCDELANLALNGEELLIDEGYLPKESIVEHSVGVYVQSVPTFQKVENEGDICRKCGTMVNKTEPRSQKRKPNQTYYFEYYFHCPNCKTNYFVEEAKRIIKNSNLFE